MNSYTKPFYTTVNEYSTVNKKNPRLKQKMRKLMTVVTVFGWTMGVHDDEIINKLEYLIIVPSMRHF